MTQGERLETVYNPLDPYEEARSRFVIHTGLRAPARYLCIGGGTGLPVVLRGLARNAGPTRGQPGVEITAVVAMSDDGGSSGRLRRSRGVPPPGDVRNCLVALSGKRNQLAELFQYRFGGDEELAGHAVGNLLLAAIAEQKGDFMEAVRLSGTLLGARGRVLPSTLAPVELVAQLEDSTQVVGERHLSGLKKKVRRVSLRPKLPAPTEGLIEAISEAHVVTIGPGSLYSSVLPNLLVDGVARALRETRALKVLVANLMTEPGETDGMSVEDHVRAIQEHAGHVVDAVLVPAESPSPVAVECYAQRGSMPVSYDRQALVGLGVVPVEFDVVHEGTKIRHDSVKLSRALNRLYREGL